MAKDPCRNCILRIFVIAPETTNFTIHIKLLKWPPSESGLFPADAKRTLELELEPTAPSEECAENIKKAYCSMSSIKIYYHDGFEVMPIVREEDFTFCMRRFQKNYADYVNHFNMNRLYIVANSPPRSNELEKQPIPSCPVTGGKLANDPSKADLDFSERVKKTFPSVEIIPGNKFKCLCGQIGALNGPRRIGNIKRHVNTTCRLGGNRMGRTLKHYFGKIAAPVQEEQM